MAMTSSMQTTTEQLGECHTYEQELQMVHLIYTLVRTKQISELARCHQS